MGAEYEVLLRSPTGTLLTDLSKVMLSLDLTRTVNQAGELTITLPAGVVQDSWLVDDAILEVWRQPDGGAIYLEGETVFFIHAVEKHLKPDGSVIITLYAPDALELLNHHIVPYDAGTTYGTITAAADDLLKSLFASNMGSLATDITRNMSPWVTVQANRTAAPSQTKIAGWTNLLQSMQEVAAAAAAYNAGIYLAFDLVSTVPSSGVALEFRTYTTLRGSDHRWNANNPSLAGAVVLRAESGNLVEVDRMTDVRSMSNAIYGVGQATSGTRPYQLALGSDVGSNPWSRHEFIQDCKGATDTATLLAEAQAALWTQRIAKTFAGTVQDSPSLQYGVQFGWGDFVTCVFDNEQIDCRVDCVNLHVEGEQEIISLVLRSDK